MKINQEWAKENRIINLELEGIEVVETADEEA